MKAWKNQEQGVQKRFFLNYSRPNCLSGGRFYNANHGPFQANMIDFKILDVTARERDLQRIGDGS